MNEIQWKLLYGEEMKDMVRSFYTLDKFDDITGYFNVDYTSYLSNWGIVQGTIGDVTHIEPFKRRRNRSLKRAKRKVTRRLELIGGKITSTPFYSMVEEKIKHEEKIDILVGEEENKNIKKSNTIGQFLKSYFK